MVNFRKFSIFAFSIFALLQVFILASCSGEADFSYPDDGKTDPDYSDTIHVLKTHTEGQGFPIVIMGDGYLAGDITAGTYRSAVEKAEASLFDMEPMKSLEKYFDVIEVAIPSTQSGITSTKKTTAFQTYYSTSTTEVHGDSILALKWAQKALTYAYNITAQSVLEEKMKSCQIVMLLNCSAYKGCTLLSYDDTVTDSIPKGCALSYIPSAAKVGTRDVFTDLVQHEAVGHGIGKLADEYFEPSMMSPYASEISNFKLEQKYGYMLNATYNNSPTDEVYDYTYASSLSTGENTTSIICCNIYKHPFQESDLGYPLTQDSRYANEDIAWYQGAFTKLTYTDKVMGHVTINGTMLPCFECKKDFYRPSKYGIMNATTDENNKTFNALSRYLIYRRVMRAALGSTFTSDLRKSADIETFATFDAPSLTTSSSAKGAFTSTVPEYLMDSSTPKLVAPKMIKFPKF